MSGHTSFIIYMVVMTTNMAAILTTPVHASSRPPYFLSNIASNLMDTNTASASSSSSSSSAASSYPRVNFNPAGLLRACRLYITQLQNSPPSADANIPRNDQKRINFDKSSLNDGPSNRIQNYDSNNFDTLRDLRSPVGDFLPFFSHQQDSRDQRDDGNFQSSPLSSPSRQSSVDGLKGNNFLQLEARCVKHAMNRLASFGYYGVDAVSRNRVDGNDDSDDKFEMSLAVSGDPLSTNINGDVRLVPMVSSDPQVNSPLLSSPSRLQSVRFSFNHVKRSPMSKLYEINNNDRSMGNLVPMTSSKRAYSAWLKWVSQVRAKRRHRLSINNAMMSLTNMLLEDTRQRKVKNRENMRHHMYLQG